MRTARSTLLAILPVVLLGLGEPARAAEDGCAEAIEEFERVSRVISVGGETEREAERLLEAARAHCAAGLEAEAREQLTAAWELLLGDSELALESAEPLQGDPCTEGLQRVVERIPEVDVSAYARDAAEQLVEDAQGLCEESEPEAAQLKLDLAWSMLHGAP